MLVMHYSRFVRAMRWVGIVSVGLVYLGSGCGRAVGDVLRTTVTPSAPARIHDLRVAHVRVGDRGYRVFRQDWPDIRFTVTRPAREASRLVLVVPGTYTSPQNTVEGFVVLDGVVIRDHERQGWDGVAVFRDGHVEIRQTDNGKLLTRSALRAIAATGASLIQGHLLVYRGIAQEFKQQPQTLRRALVIDATGPAIVESGDLVDLNAFARDLVSWGAVAAMNLDMGAWSEGWYRDPERGTIVTIGLPNPATERQSNWILFQDARTRTK
ncbi:phosphodiester glycosidase family protein [Candidatus Uhrbacteria bacterium]|nr:phosphodiester glycosidase family protein [Candidatus Uhrbacteria bacterium]